MLGEGFENQALDGQDDRTIEPFEVYAITDMNGRLDYRLPLARSTNRRLACGTGSLVTTRKRS